MHNFIKIYLLLFSANLFAHPHHNEADAITHHGLFHVFSENGLYFILATGVGLLVFKLINSLNGNQSGHK